MEVADIRYDYVVVGAGSAGAVIASRLSENPRLSVLLIEAGEETHFYSQMPMSFGLFVNRPGVNWCYWSSPEDATIGRKISVPRGKMIGGSSAINGMVYVRGQRQDYEDWKKLGNDEWGWENVAKVFSKLENYQSEFDQTFDSSRGREGPLCVTKIYDQNPLYQGLFEAAESIGYRVNHDYNGTDQEGIARTQATIREGKRMSTAQCYIKPALKRPNLTIITRAHVEKLILDGKQCVGVVYLKEGVKTEVRSGREVVLSAGAIGSPQILELSGIGSPKVLKEQGIDVKHCLAAVGENFQDHMMARLQWKLKLKKLSYNYRMKGLRLPLTGLEYLIKRTGPLSLPAAPLIAFLKTPLSPSRPDFQIQFIPFSIEDPVKRKFHSFPGMAVAGLPSRPKSKGSIHICSPSSQDQPRIRFNFLSDQEDRETFIEGFKIIRNIVNAEPMDSLRGAELSPGGDVKTDDEIESFLREKAETGYHPMGTCRMGNAENSVVNSKLQVHGIIGLRVADASIFPTMLSGNLNAPSIMVGEMASNFIKKGS